MCGVESLVSVGSIVRPHGVRGEVKIHFFADRPERFKEIRAVYLERKKDEGEWVRVESGRIQGSRSILKLAGVDDRESADSLRGLKIMVRKEDRPLLPEGSFYIFDLIGLEVVSTDGRKIGSVVDVLSTPAQDVYVVEHGGKEIMIPAVKQFIKQVDIEKGFVVVETIEGLVE
ncbi:MAG: ribosome maturation factor RimM [bacterium]